MASTPPLTNNNERDRSHEHQAEDERADDPKPPQYARARLPGEITDKAKGDPPGDAAEGVPEEELTKAHPIDPRQPGGGEPHERDPAGEEHCFRPVPSEEPVAGSDCPAAMIPQRAAPDEHVTAEATAQQISGVVAGDRRGDPDQDH